MSHRYLKFLLPAFSAFSRPWALPGATRGDAGVGVNGEFVLVGSPRWYELGLDNPGSLPTSGGSPTGAVGQSPQPAGSPPPLTGAVPTQQAAAATTTPAGGNLPASNPYQGLMDALNSYNEQVKAFNQNIPQPVPTTPAPVTPQAPQLPQLGGSGVGAVGGPGGGSPLAGALGRTTQPNGAPSPPGMLPGGSGTPGTGAFGGFNKPLPGSFGGGGFSGFGQQRRTRGAGGFGGQRY